MKMLIKPLKTRNNSNCWKLIAIIFVLVFFIGIVNCKKQVVEIELPVPSKPEPPVPSEAETEEDIDFQKITEIDKKVIIFFGDKDRFEERRGIIFSKSTSENTINYFKYSLIELKEEEDCKHPGPIYSPSPGVYCYNCEDGSIVCSNDEKIIRSLKLNIIKMLETTSFNI